MIACICAALLAQIGPAITFTTEAAPLKRVVEQLAVKTGRKLVVSSELAKDVVCLRVRDMPAQECLDNLASSVSGTWQPEPGTLKLVPDLELENQLRAKELAERKTLLKQAIDRMADQQRKQGTFDKQSGQRLVAALKGDDDRYPDMRSRVNSRDSSRLIQRVFGEGPGGRLAVRLILGMDLTTISQIRPDTSIPFAPRPNKMQQPLGSNADQAIQQFAKEQNLWADYVNSLGAGGAGTSPYLGDPRALATRVNADQLNVRLRISIDQYNFAPQVSLTVTGPDGGTVAYYWGYLGGGYRWDGGDDPITQPKAGVRTGTSLRLSPLGAEWIALQTPGRKKALSTELLDFLLNPETHEPLTESSKLLMQVCEQRDQDLIACLPDRAFWCTYLFRSQTAPDAKLVLESYASYCKLEQHGRLMLISPIDSATARSERTPRSALGEFARAIRARHAVTLDDLATFCASMDADSVLHQSYIEALVPGGSRSVSMSNPSMLRAYGLMSREQRTALWDGGAVNVANLPDKARKILAKAIFYMNGFLAIRLMPEKPATGRIQMFSAEPTDILPNGFPAESFLDGRPNDTPIVLASSEAGPTRIMSADDLASSVFAKERPDSDTLYQFNGEEYNQFVTGKQRLLRVAIHVGQGFKGYGQLSDLWFDSGGSHAFADLPESFRNDYNNALTGMRKRFEKIPRPPQKTPPP